jgi:hypothetical protein
MAVEVTRQLGVHLGPGVADELLHREHPSVAVLGSPAQNLFHIIQILRLDFAAELGQVADASKQP